MAKQITAEAWSGFIGRLRQEDYRGVASELSHALELHSAINPLGLKALLLNSVDECIKGRDRKALTYRQVMNYEIILVALGLLKGYCGDMNGIDKASLTGAMEVGERRIKYLKLGPFLHLKKDPRYLSYDTIESDNDRKAVKKSLAQQDGRLIKKDLAVYLAGIKDIETYIKQSERNYTKDGLLRLPEQRCLLEDVPFPVGKNGAQVPSSDEVSESTASTDPEQISNGVIKARSNSEVSQETAATAPLSFGWGDNGGGRPSYTLAQVRGAFWGTQLFLTLFLTALSATKRIL